MLKTLQPGALLKNNSYRVDRLLGQGGFGAVYLANDLILEKLCAIKEGFDNSPGAQAQFEVEARILANLNHPHLPRVTDNFIEGSSGLQYLVMEYVQGQDLGKLLEQSGPLPEDQVRAWGDQVLDALAYLHAHRPRPIIHRDIKPDNIRLLPDGKTVKLVDFGIAKVGGAADQTHRGARGATPGYSPPEQYGTGTSAYSDIYALGATLYHLLTKVVPPDAIDRAYSDAQLVPPRQLNPAISEHIEQVILTAMQLDPRLRFPDAGQMRDALHEKRPTLILASCPYCGQRVRPEAKFCASCGRSIDPRDLSVPNVSVEHSATRLAPAVSAPARQAGEPPVILIPKPPAAYLLDPARPDTGLSSLPELVGLCDREWSAALGWLRAGRIEAFLHSIGEDGLAQSTRPASQAADPNLALESLLRTCGAQPPPGYKANLREVLRQLGFGFSFQFLQNPAPDLVTLVIENTSRRGYLHGKVLPVAPWLSLPDDHFGCLPGQAARLDLHVDAAGKKMEKFALRRELFEIVFL